MVDEHMRRTLHEQLDNILNRRAALEELTGEKPLANYLGSLIASANSSALPDSAAAKELFVETVTLAAAITGERIRSAALPRTFRTDPEQRALFQLWLSYLLPLLRAPPQMLPADGPVKELSAFDVLDALSALGAGEVQPIFMANRGKNRRANRWSLARTKLDALVWKKRLVATGLTEKQAKYRVMVTFGEQWDTIRKWESQCEQILGSFHTKMEINLAGGQSDFYVNPAWAGWFRGAPDLDGALAAAGDKYRRELARSAESSRRKSKPG